MLNTLTNPSFSDEAKAKGWESEIKKVWTSYLSRLFNVEISDETKSDVELLEFYNKVVKKMRPVLRRKKDGKGLEISGLDGFSYKSSQNTEIKSS